MKKFVLFVLSLTFLFVSLKVFAGDDITSQGELIKSEQNIEKNSAKKIKHHKIKKTVNTYGDKITLTCPDCNFSEIIKNYYNSIEGLNFENYPDTGWFYLPVRTEENVYFNEISIEKDSIKYDKELESSFIPIEEERFAIGPASLKILDIHPLYIPRWLANEDPTFYDEEVKIENGNLIFTLKEVFKAKKIGYMEEQNVNFIPQKSIDIIDTIKNTNSADKLFKALNSNFKYPLENYPKNFVIYLSDNHKSGSNELIFYKNGKKIKTLKFAQDYHFLFPDSYSRINRNLPNSRIKISFSEADSIIAKKGFKWGIIDRDGKQKVPFIYDKLYPLTGLIKETLIVPENLDSNKINNTDIKMKYLGKSKESNVFLGIQNDCKLIIDDKNNTLLKIENNTLEDKINNEIVNSEIMHKIIKKQRLHQIKEEKKEDIKEKIEDSPHKIVEIIKIPFQFIAILLWYFGIIN